MSLEFLPLNTFNILWAYWRAKRVWNYLPHTTGILYKTRPDQLLFQNYLIKHCQFPAVRLTFLETLVPSLVLVETLIVRAPWFVFLCLAFHSLVVYTVEASLTLLYGHVAGAFESISFNEDITIQIQWRTRNLSPEYVNKTITKYLNKSFSGIFINCCK